MTVSKARNGGQRNFTQHIDFDSLAVQDITTHPLAKEKDNRRSAREKRIRNLTERAFVVWDGEGADNEKRKAQKYVLFGAYNGVQHDYITRESLGTFECLNHIIKVGKRNPGAWHVSFAFGYDVNMILRNLSVKQFTYLRLHRRMFVGQNFRIEHIPGKWFQVTHYVGKSKSDRFTVRIYDVFGFYQSSFLAAIGSNIADNPAMSDLDTVEEGKAKRHTFTYKDIDYITQYWKVEQILFLALVNRLRDMCYSAGLYIAKWHGPGELASFLYRTNGIKDCKVETDSRIYELCRLAYCGGRFERFHIGRFRCVYGFDINSAYPDAISKLPNLATGTWVFDDNPRTIESFALYRIELRGKERVKPGPLFRRDPRGNITFPWELNGWYWGPEVQAMVKHHPELKSSVQEGWVFEDDGTRPFAFVRKLFEQRRIWKQLGNGAQLALKLALNSLYGKQAQRAGWQRNNRAPTWHQLEWAGWVTSYTRAKLYSLMECIPYERLIAVETDGIYTTATPEDLGIENSGDLGGWEVSYYDEIIYLQSGVYAKRIGEDWELKYRGLDKDSLTWQDFVAHSKALLGWPSALSGIPAIELRDSEGIVWHKVYTPYPKDLWPKLNGVTTRFIGYENALFREQSNRGPFRAHHCVWETSPHEIDCERGAKRVHKIDHCKACNTAPPHNAYDMPHDTVIKNLTMFKHPDRPPTRDIDSYPHDIPWLDLDDEEVKYEWRQYQQEQEGLIRSD